MAAHRETGPFGLRATRSGAVVGWRHGSPASVGRAMLPAGLGSALGGSFCVALGTFFLLVQRL